MPDRSRGLVDSGADSTTLPLEWAAILGVDYEKDCVEGVAGTAGGSTVQYAYPPGIEVVFMGKTLRLGAVFTKCPIILLGREDFFRYFAAVGFDQAEENLVLTAAPDWEATVAAAHKSVKAMGDEAEKVKAARAELAAKRTSVPS